MYLTKLCDERFIFKTDNFMYFYLLPLVPVKTCRYMKCQIDQILYVMYLSIIVYNATDIIGMYSIRACR